MLYWLRVILFCISAISRGGTCQRTGIEHLQDGAKRHMKLIWLEDFLALLQAGSFSRAAQSRHITQPAFSRRIQMLEKWLGVTLVERGTTGLQLTESARRHAHEVRTLILQIQETRRRIQADLRGSRRVMLACQHTLTITWLPDLLRITQRHAPAVELSVDSLDRDDSIARFLRGPAELLLSMEDALLPLHAMLSECPRLPLGTERLIAVSAPTSAGRPAHAPHATRLLRLLTYPPGMFMGEILYRHCMPDLMRQYKVRIVQESGFVAGLKEMTLAGMGMAWLPRRLIERELKTGLLVEVGNLPTVDMPVFLYRRPRSALPGVIDELWSLYERHACLSNAAD